MRNSEVDTLRGSVSIHQHTNSLFLPHGVGEMNVSPNAFNITVVDNLGNIGLVFAAVLGDEQERVLTLQDH